MKFKNKETNYTAVKEYVTEHVLNGKQAVSMNTLQTIYGVGVGDSGYRHMFKQKLINDYKDKLSFLSVGRNDVDVVVSTSVPDNEISFKDKAGCIIKAAEYIRNDVNVYCESLPHPTWPPDTDELSDLQKSKPSSLVLFLERLLHATDRK